MKSIFLFIFVLFTLAACEKTVEKAEDNIITMAMTNGQWKVTNFTRGSSNMTTDFADFTFQFLENRTVKALKNGSVNATGTWEANATARSIASNFQNAQNPLGLLNGVWIITKNSWTYVEASQTVNNETYTLRLDKV